MYHLNFVVKINFLGNPLLEELEALRQQNLDLEQTIVDLEIQLEGRVSPTSFDKQAQILIQQDV